MASSRVWGLCFIITMVFVLRCLAGDDATAEKTLKSRHFLVYYKGERKFAARVLGSAEKYYKQIADDLGFARHDKMWVWENRAKIYVYASRDEFADATGAPQWAGGKASQAAKAICGVSSDASFLSAVLPHELAHLMFRDLIGFKGDIPLWLDEGVAVWAERGGRKSISAGARQLLEQGKLVPLSVLMTMDIRKSEDAGAVSRFYAQAASLVGYIVSRKGADSFRKMCRVIRDGKGLEDALKLTYPDSINSVDKLQAAWLRHLQEAIGDTDDRL